MCVCVCVCVLGNWLRVREWVMSFRLSRKFSLRFLGRKKSYTFSSFLLLLRTTVYCLLYYCLLSTLYIYCSCNTTIVVLLISFYWWEREDENERLARTRAIASKPFVAKDLIERILRIPRLCSSNLILHFLPIKSHNF